MDDLLLHRYRLALALIPDPDAAGDLYMTAQSDADLRRRAAHWRETAGLEPAVEPHHLPELTVEQREHALHLARRGATHRRVQRWLAGLTAVVLLAGSGYLAYESIRPRLDVNPAFAESPLAGAPGPGNLNLSLYDMRFDAEGEALEVWWELTGTGASDRARRLRPQLRITGTSTWRDHVNTRFYSTSPDRLLATSRFRVSSLPQRISLRIEEGRSDADDFMVVVQIPPRLRGR